MSMVMCGVTVRVVRCRLRYEVRVKPPVRDVKQCWSGWDSDKQHLGINWFVKREHPKRPQPQQPQLSLQRTPLTVKYPSCLRVVFLKAGRYITQFLIGGDYRWSERPSPF